MQALFLKKQDLEQFFKLRIRYINICFQFTYEGEDFPSAIPNN